MKLIYKNFIFLFCFLGLIICMSELWNLLKNLKYSMYPTKLSVSDLKNVLKYRGIDFNDIIEKKELWELVNSTGRINSFELSLANGYSENIGKCKGQSAIVIPSEEMFNELVEDSKDSAWILMTIMPKSFSHVNDNDRRKLNEVWCSIQTLFTKFGVNMAILNCGKLYNLCWERGFHRSPFVLVLPRGRERVKDSVDFFVYPYHHSLLMSNPTGSGGVKHKHAPQGAAGVSAKVIERSVVKWLRDRLAHRVIRWQYVTTKNSTISSTTHDSNKTDATGHSTANFISVFQGQSSPNSSNSSYFSSRYQSLLHTSPPLSISANSVKFTGRVHFSVASPRDLPSPLSAQLHSQDKAASALSHYLVLSSDDTIYQYGDQEGQTLSFESLQLFLRHVCPSTNDMFIWNLILVNLLISFQAVFQAGSYALRVGYYLWYFFIFNFVYCCVFLFVLSALNFSPLLSRFNHYLLGWWRRLALTKFVNHLRYLQLNQDIDLVLFLVTWSLFVLIIGKFHKDGDDSSPSTQQGEGSDASPGGGLHGPILEPYDPEAGQQIALLSALGSLNLTLQQQPPVYISRLLKWSFQVPKKLASKLASRYKAQNLMPELAGCPTLFTPSTLSPSPSSSSPNSSPESPPLTSTPTQQWPNGYIFTEDCCICLQRYRTNEILCGLPCGHAFHDICIYKWLVQWGKDDCPQCRWPAYKDKPC